MDAPGILWIAIPLGWALVIWSVGWRNRDFRQRNPQLYRARTALATASTILLVLLSLVPAVIVDPPWSLAALVLLGAPSIGLAWAHVTSLRTDGDPRLRQLADRQARWARAGAYWWTLAAMLVVSVALSFTAVTAGGPVLGAGALVAGLATALGVGRGLGALLFLPPPLYPASRGATYWGAATASWRGLGASGLVTLAATLVAALVLERPAPVVAALLGVHAALGFVGGASAVELWRRDGPA